jgi:hypothetical protein
MQNDAEFLFPESLIERLVTVQISEKQRESLSVFVFRLLGSKIGPVTNGDEFQVWYRIHSRTYKKFLFGKVQIPKFGQHTDCISQLIESIKRKLAGSFTYSHPFKQICTKLYCFAQR